MQIVTQNQQPIDYFKSLKKVFFVLLAWQVLFAIVIYILNHIGNGFIDTANSPISYSYFIYVVPIFALAATVFSIFFFKNKLNGAKKCNTFPEKMLAYRSALVVRWAIVEAASFFAIAAYMITGVIYYLAIAALLIIYFITLIPSKQRTTKDLELNPSEENKLNEYKI